MPTITAVEPQKSPIKCLASGRKNPKRFNIFLDGQFAFGADEDLVVSKRLIPGKVIEPRGLDKLLFEAEVGKLMERMYGLFSIRQRSEKEIRNYLKNLSFKRKIKNQEEISEMMINLVIERLKQKRLINDIEFAKAWVESRRRSKQKGINSLKSELYQKGISREIIEEVISPPAGGSSVISEEELAAKALGKKMKSWKNLEPQEFKKKAYEFLMRRGFEYSVIRKTVSELF